MCGLPAADIITIVTTKWDRVRDSDGRARLRALEQGLWAPLLRGGSRVEHLRQREGEGYADVFRGALTRVGQGPVKIRLLQELVDEQRLLEKTEAGRRVPGLENTERNAKKGKRKAKSKSAPSPSILSSIRTGCAIQ